MDVFYVTDKGLEYFAATGTGKVIHFTRGKFGDGDVGIQTVTSLTDLVNPLGEMAISKSKTQGNLVTVTTQFSNRVNGSILNPFNLKEIGLYAKLKNEDGTDDSEYPETLVAYSYAQGADEGDRIPGLLTEFIINWVCTVSNSENVEVTVGSLAFVTYDEFETAMAEKQDKNLIVTVAGYGEDNGGMMFLTLSHSYSEIMAAHNAGKNVYGYLNGLFTPFVEFTDTMVVAIHATGERLELGSGEGQNNKLAILAYSDNTRYVTGGDIRVLRGSIEDDLDEKVDKVDGFGVAQANSGDSDRSYTIDFKNDDGYYSVQVPGFNWIMNNIYNTKADKSDTLSGYGITDAYTKTETDNAIDTKVSELVGSAPETLNTLKELSEALGNDEDFATTMTNELAKKADKYNPEDGGFVGGMYATSGDGGGAIGRVASTEKGGAVGRNASSSSGGAIGYVASTTLGGAVGNNASSGYGGAVGSNAKTGHGFAGGDAAKTVDADGNGIDAVQLGRGTNNTPNTAKIYDYTIMNADGSIPAERLSKVITFGTEDLTAGESELETGTIYFVYE